MGSAVGKAVGSGAGNLISPVVVNAASHGIGAGLGSGLGSAVGAAAAGAGLNSALSGQGSKPQTTPAPPSSDADPNALDINQVSPVTVNAMPQANIGGGASSLSSLIPALGTALGSSVAPQISLGGAAATPTPLANITPENNRVSEVAVAAPQSQATDALAGLASGAGVGAMGAADAAPADPMMEDTTQDGEGDDKKKGLLGLLGLLGLSAKDLVGMGLLGASVIPGLIGNNDKPGGSTNPQTALTDLADQSKAQGGRLTEKALAGMEGQIGGGALKGIARQVRAAQAAIRQRYASMGMSGSTAESQDLNAAAQAGTDMQFQIGREMAQTGLQAAASLTGQSAQVYAALMNAQTAQDTQLGNALANFAAAVVRG